MSAMNPFNSLRAVAAADLDLGDPAALPPTENQINRMPDELLVMIFKYLKPQDLVNCRAVCRRWHRVAGDNTLWRQHFIFVKSLNVPRHPEAPPLMQVI